MRKSYKTTIATSWPTVALCAQRKEVRLAPGARAPAPAYRISISTTTSCVN